MPSSTTSDIRAWALQNGHPVGDRGRLPSEVVAAYDKAHRKGKPSVPAAKTATRPAAKRAPVLGLSTPKAPDVPKSPAVAAVVPKAPVADPVVARAPEADGLSARLVAVELRLAELTRRLAALEAAPPPRRFGRRST